MPRASADAAVRNSARQTSTAPSADALLYDTKHDLGESTRREVIHTLNQRLADAIDLQGQAKQAHWNVKGPNFIALHKLFDDVHGAVDEYVDLLAERVVQLGGIADGILRSVADRSTLPDYPPTAASGDEHVEALSTSLARFAHSTRLGIEELDTLGDAVSADLLTEISRGSDKWLWFVEAHRQETAIAAED
jgi:starvation-inducible DNA-binding protein